MKKFLLFQALLFCFALSSKAAYPVSKAYINRIISPEPHVGYFEVPKAVITPTTGVPTETVVVPTSTLSAFVSYGNDPYSNSQVAMLFSNNFSSSFVQSLPPGFVADMVSGFYFIRIIEIEPGMLGLISGTIWPVSLGNANYYYAIRQM